MGAIQKTETKDVSRKLPRTPEGRERFRQLVEIKRCEKDIKYFFNKYLFTYDPRLASEGKNPHLPFLLRPKQDELIDWVQELLVTKDQGLITKTRDTGMSYVICGFYLHQWRFVEGFSGGLGSRKGSYVDNGEGDSKSLFFKVRYMLDRLPNWLKPDGFSRNKHSSNSKLINPDNGASITGEAGRSIGRGNRTTIYFVDEWANVVDQDAANQALSATTDTIIKGGTPKGLGDLFYQELVSGRYKHFALHWRDDPSKNHKEFIDGEWVYPWYEEVKRKNDELTVAQEYDISFTASAKGVVIPSQWVQAAIDLDLEFSSPARAVLDPAGEEGGGDEYVYGCRYGPVVTRILALTGEVMAQDEEAVQLAYEDEVTEFYYDAVGEGSSVTSTIKRSEDDYPFEVWGVKNNYAPSDREFEDQPEVKVSLRFKNFAAENWWSLRMRFKKTWEHVNGKATYPLDELISIPNEPKLIMQLSQPTYRKNSSDKIEVNKYGSTRKTAKSPDFAEVLMYLFCYLDPKHKKRKRRKNISMGNYSKKNDWNT